MFLETRCFSNDVVHFCCVALRMKDIREQIDSLIKEVETQIYEIKE